MGSDRLKWIVRDWSENSKEVARAFLALLAIFLLISHSRQPLDFSPWSALTLTLAVWGVATATVWYCTNPRQAWRDCLAPFAISLISAPAGQLAGGLGNAILGAVALQLLSVTRSTSVICSRSYDLFEVNQEPSSTDEVPISATTKRNSFCDSEMISPVVLNAGGTKDSGLDEPCANRTSIPIQSRHTASETQAQESVQAPEASTAIPPAKSHDIPESWTRRECDGHVSIEAVVYARFSVGERRAAVHIPFFPPLPEVPVLETEPLESGCDVEITVESALRHGARLQITRSTATETEDIPIAVVIYTSADEEVEFS